MLSTRNFWFCHPTEIDHGWDQILSRYEQSEPWPEVCLPNKEDLLNTLLHTKDSAPGPDGLPYAAWRLLPEVTVEAMASFFFDIMEGTALPPLQVGVWIPKAKMGPEADCFRPFGHAGHPCEACRWHGRCQGDARYCSKHASFSDCHVNV